jgi:hypothetical protein
MIQTITLSTIQEMSREARRSYDAARSDDTTVHQHDSVSGAPTILEHPQFDHFAEYWQSGMHQPFDV